MGFVFNDSGEVIEVPEEYEEQFGRRRPTATTADAAPSDVSESTEVSEPSDGGDAESSLDREVSSPQDAIVADETPEIATPAGSTEPEEPTNDSISSGATSDEAVKAESE
jgi:hypothetical protein